MAYIEVVLLALLLIAKWGKYYKKIWIYVSPFLDWKFLISYSIPFMCVNGWAWIGTILFTIIGANWFTIASTTWLGILWLPCTPEKLVTIPVALFIHIKLFGKSSEKMERMLEEAKSDWRKLWKHSK